jgi:Holliday junction resolvase
LNNKKRGTSFERYFAQLLSEQGFWARLDKGKAQTCDIIAGKDGIIYLFECKTCKTDYFNFNRIEDNQSMSRKKFIACGNAEAYFVFEVEGSIYLSKEPIKTPSKGKEWGQCIADLYR